MSQKADKPVVWVLLSGGIDSAACAAFYLRQGFAVETLYIDYGQAAAKHEEVAAAAIAERFGVPHVRYMWSGGSIKGSGEICGRNAFLLFGALMEIGNRHGLLAIGLHSGTPYYDCGESFMSATQLLLDGCTDGRIKAVAPFLTWNKREIWEFCIDCGVALGLTYSCEKGSDKPCGECLSCLDRRTLNAVSNLSDSTHAVWSES
ncbi:MAG: 7-cyano-7-deazaguanine synthase [Thermoguttaceae bacterium]